MRINPSRRSTYIAIHTLALWVNVGKKKISENKTTTETSYVIAYAVLYTMVGSPQNRIYTPSPHKRELHQLSYTIKLNLTAFISNYT